MTYQNLYQQTNNSNLNFTQLTLKQSGIHTNKYNIINNNTLTYKLNTNT